ncbi:hypothetical protein [Sphingomonas rhizophila]|nr:hypothetical protein [Sphingomonas rhizophila]
MPRRRWKTGCLGIAGVAAGLAAIAAAFVYVQAQRTPPGVP